MANNLGRKSYVFDGTIEEMERWKADAKGAGFKSFAPYIRALLDQRTGIPAAMRDSPKRSRVRSQTCEHRIPVGSFCKTCD